MAKVVTFESQSGYTLRVRPAGMLLSVQIERLLQRDQPKPPMQAVDLGDGRTRMEANASDPDYLAAVEKWQTEYGFRFMDQMIKLCIDVDVEQNEVMRVIDLLGDPSALPEYAELQALPHDAPAYVREQLWKLLFVKYIVIGGADEMQRLTRVMTGRLPTEEGIAVQQDTFQGEVQGA